MGSIDTLSDQEKKKINKPFPISRLAIGKDTFRCPLCGGTVRITGSKNQGKIIIVRCSQCNLKGSLHDSEIQFTSRKMPQHSKNKAASQTNNETAVPDINTANMSDQEFYEYIAKHKGNSKRILPKGEHKKIITKHSKPSGHGKGTYRKPGSAKLWS